MNLFPYLTRDSSIVSETTFEAAQGLRKDTKELSASPIGTPWAVYFSELPFSSLCSKACPLNPAESVWGKTHTHTHTKKPTGVKRLCDVLRYFCDEGTSDPTTFSFYRFQSVPAEALTSFVHLTNIYGAPTMGQILCARHWGPDGEQSSHRPRFDGAALQRSNGDIPTITLKSILLHPTGHANDLVFFLREIRNHGRVLSRGHDKIRSLTSPGQGHEHGGRNRGQVRRGAPGLLVTQGYYMLQRGYRSRTGK